ncbi:MAG: ABC transporter permease subunit, partial [Anaerolineales bacterium]|nr:ABC transporter permease subunit [Anaerolineales bacterium]
MRPSHILAVLRRETQEIVKSRGLMLAIFLPPFFITLIPLIAVAVLGRVIESDSSGDASDFAMMIQLMPELQSWSVGEVAMFVILQQFLTFFLMMPLIISLSIAAQSIVSEKQNKSLEPLLATPIKTSELLFAKALAAMLPAVLATWAAFFIFIAAARFLIASERVFNALLDPKWLIALLVLSPLLSLLSVSLAVV